MSPITYYSILQVAGMVNFVQDEMNKMTADLTEEITAKVTAKVTADMMSKMETKTL